MFEHFGANSLSAFRRKFWAYELRPHVSTRAGGTGSLGVAGTAQVGPTGAPTTPSQGASRPRWGVQQAGDETYVGELLDGRRHGTGIMLTKVREGLSAMQRVSGSFVHAAAKARSPVQHTCCRQQTQRCFAAACMPKPHLLCTPGQTSLPVCHLLQAQRSWVLHAGRFAEGKRNGPAVVATSRGERFEGFFLDDVMWGPGEYRFAAPEPASIAHSGCNDQGAGPTPAAEEPDGRATHPLGAAKQASEQAAESAGAPPHRIRFRGMMNGQPAGKGCLEWSDGSTQAGQFDGCSCYLAMREQDVAGVLLVAADNAQKGRAAAAEAQAASARQQPDVAQRAVQLFASLEPAREGVPAGKGGQPRL